MHMPKNFCLFFVVTFFSPYHSIVHPGDEDETSRLLQPAVEGSSHVVQSVVVTTIAEFQDLHHEYKC